MPTTELTQEQKLKYVQATKKWYIAEEDIGLCKAMVSVNRDYSASPLFHWLKSEILKYKIKVEKTYDFYASFNQMLSHREATIIKKPTDSQVENLYFWKLKNSVSRVKALDFIINSLTQ